METVSKLSEALNPRIEEAKAKLFAAIESGSNKLIRELTTELANLRSTQAKMAKVMDDQDEEPSPEELAEISAAHETVKNHIRSTILAESKYYYIHEMEKFLLHRPDAAEWMVVGERSLKNHHARLVPGTDYWHAFIEVLKEDGHWFYGRTSSFKDVPGKLNMLRPQLLQPLAGTPHPVFDMVIRSVCGDKAENIDHLERVLVAKWCNPYQYLLPVVCFSDDGGTGKSLFVGKVVTTMFGASSVGSNVRMSDFAGQFNGHLAGKLAILINENCEDSYNHNAIKMIAGSEKITFTNKNQMPYDGDNAALIFISGNSIAGSIRLDGGDTDRRFSVIKGTKNLESYITPWLDTEEGKPHTHHETKDWIVNTGQDILSDPDQAAIWLNHLITKHGRLNHVAALHGKDYDSIVSTQTPLWNQVFETIFDLGFDYIRKSVMYDFYRYEAKLQGNNASLGKKKFYLLAEKWIAKNKADVVECVTNWDNSTASVYIDGTLLGSRTKPKLLPNDHHYFVTDGNQKEWRVAL